MKPTVWTLCGVLAWGCTEESTPPSTLTTPVAEAAQFSVPLLLDGASLGTLAPSPGSGPWDLVDLVPPEVPPISGWALVEILGQKGQVFKLEHPGSQAAPEVLRVVLHEGGPAVGLFLDPPETASMAVKARARKPIRMLVRPKSVHIFTVMPEPAAPPWPRLRTKVDGKNQGFIQEGELAELARTLEPGRPMHEGGWTVAQVAGLRADGADVVSARLVGAEDKVVTLDAAALAGPELSLLKPSRNGVWVYKRFSAGDSPSRTHTLRDVQVLELRTAPPG